MDYVDKTTIEINVNQNISTGENLPLHHQKNKAEENWHSPQTRVWGYEKKEKPWIRNTKLRKEQETGIKSE